jgi:DNA-binding NtrC family response regulator
VNRTVLAVPPDWLLRQYRHTSLPLLVVGDSPAARAAAAESFWRTGPLRSGPLVRVDGARDEAALIAALEDWLTLGQDGRALPSLRAAERGTLFVDAVESLSPRAQRLLLAFVDRFLSPVIDVAGAGWGGRLIVGASGDPLAAVERGRLSYALLDALDKLRFETLAHDQRGAA